MSTPKLMTLTLTLSESFRPSAVPYPCFSPRTESVGFQINCIVSSM
uniref:Uncharacterized protein n=2 Tax=Anguilla anguilla TaxID=7936 RepID=A0A0E9P838_ANGAN